MRYILIILFLLLSILFISSYGTENEKKDNNNKTDVVVENISVDNYYVKGSNKQYFSRPPKKVIVVGENETETLLELGLAPNIMMAVAQNNRDYAMKSENWEKFKTLSVCPSGYLNMEYITSLNPDLIIAQECVFIRSRLNNTDYWNKRGINTLIPLNTNSPSKHVSKETVDKEMKFICDLGKVFQIEDNAQKIIEDTYNIINKINDQAISYKKPHVMIVEFISTMVCYDRNKLVGDMVSRIGGIVNENQAVIGFENIIKENPDILFVVCSHADYGKCITKITENPALKNLNCVKNKKVFSIPLRFTYGTGCRTKDGLKFLAEKMYPGIKI